MISLKMKGHRSASPSRSNRATRERASRARMLVGRDDAQKNTTAEPLAKESVRFFESDRKSPFVRVEGGIAGRAGVGDHTIDRSFLRHRF